MKRTARLRRVRVFSPLLGGRDDARCRRRGALLLAGIATATATSITGSPALALAAVVAAHSPSLPAADKQTIAGLFDGRRGKATGRISVIADKIVCRIGNVDIAARSCEVSFASKTVSLTGREANELYATEAMAGVASDGTAGTIYKSLSRLKCALNLNAIRQRDGSGADCSYEAAN